MISINRRDESRRARSPGWTALALTLLAALALLLYGLLRPQPPAVSDSALRARLTTADVRPIDLNLPTNEAQIALGRALFFDKALSGDEDISCATCHHPTLASADNRALSVGAGGSGLGATRVRGVDRPTIPRNAPEIFNRGSMAWRTMFWDGRIAQANYLLDTPALTNLPAGLDSPLAAQALFPILSQAEMRGGFDEDDSRLDFVTAGRVDGVDPVHEWNQLLIRLLSYDEYQVLFSAAYPEAQAFTIAHVANALAAFEVAAFSFDDTPFDRYLTGDNAALTDRQKAGALLFFGAAGCSHCHSGPLLTDQQFYNLGVPQLGPGKENPAGYDFGRMLETERVADRFAFRTPPLRNVALTAPYMHNGAFATLEAAVNHHINLADSLAEYDISQLDPELRDTVKLQPRSLEPLLESLTPYSAAPPQLTDDEVELVLAFLDALTSPAARDMAHLVPARVPSGLPVGD